MKKSVLTSLLLLVTLAAQAQTPTGTATPTAGTISQGAATAATTQSGSPAATAAATQTAESAPVQRSFASRPPVAFKTPSLKEKLIALWDSFCLKFMALMKSLNVFSVVAKIEKFVDSMTKQNGAAIAGAENGDWTVTKRRPATNDTAKKVQNKLDKIQDEKLKKIDSVDTNF